MATAPPIAALLGWLLLGESLSLIAALGMALTVAGIAWVLAARPLLPGPAARAGAPAGQHPAPLAGQRPRTAPVDPRRTTTAEKALRESGLTNVHILDGGITAWQNKGFEVSRGTPRWDLERQVRLVAGLIVLVAVVASIVVPGLKWVAAVLGAAGGEGGVVAFRHGEQPRGGAAHRRGAVFSHGAAQEYPAAFLAALGQGLAQGARTARS